MQLLGSIAAVWTLGFFYFIGALPAGVAFGLPVVATAIIAWIGYAAGGLVVALAGEPLRAWLMRKLKVSPTPDRTSRIYRIWDRYGLWALALIAPVTIGPQTSALLGLSLGAPKWKLTAALAIGVIPWCILFATLTALGVKIAE